MIERAENLLERLNAMAPRHDAVIHSPHPPAECARRLRVAFEIAGQTSVAGRPIGVISDSGGWLAVFSNKYSGAARMTLTIEPADAGARLVARTELGPFIKLAAIVALVLIAISVLDFVGDGLTALTSEYRHFYPFSRLVSLLFFPAIVIAAGLWARRAIADDHAHLAAFVRDTVEGLMEAAPPAALPTKPPRPTNSIVS